MVFFLYNLNAWYKQLLSLDFWNEFEKNERKINTKSLSLWIPAIIKTKKVFFIAFRNKNRRVPRMHPIILNCNHSCLKCSECLGKFLQPFMNLNETHTQIYMYTRGATYFEPLKRVSALLHPGECEFISADVDICEELLKASVCLFYWEESSFNYIAISVRVSTVSNE